MSTIKEKLKKSIARLDYFIGNNYCFVMSILPYIIYYAYIVLGVIFYKYMDSSSFYECMKSVGGNGEKARTYEPLLEQLTKKQLQEPIRTLPELPAPIPHARELPKQPEVCFNPEENAVKLGDIREGFSTAGNNERIEVLREEYARRDKRIGELMGNSYYEKTHMAEVNSRINPEENIVIREKGGSTSTEVPDRNESNSSIEDNRKMKEKEPSPAKEETKKDGIRVLRDNLDKLEKSKEVVDTELKKKEKALNESWRSWVKRASDWAFSWS